MCQRKENKCQTQKIWSINYNTVPTDFFENLGEISFKVEKIKSRLIFSSSWKSRLNRTPLQRILSAIFPGFSFQEQRTEHRSFLFQSVKMSERQGGIEQTDEDWKLCSRRPTTRSLRTALLGPDYWSYRGRGRRHGVRKYEERGRQT